MATLNQDFTKHQGSDFTIAFEIEDVGELAGFSARWSISLTPDSPKILTKQSGAGIMFVENRILVSVDKINTLNLDPNEYYHECQLLDASDKGGVVSSGTFTLLEPLHKRQ